MAKKCAETFGAGILALFLGVSPAFAGLSFSIPVGGPPMKTNGLFPLSMGQTKFDEDRLHLGMGLEPKKAYAWVVSPGEVFEMTLTLSNFSEKEQELRLTVWDWEQNPRLSRVFQGPLKESLTFEAPGRGVYVVTLDLIQASALKSRLVRSFAALPSNISKRELWRKGEFVLGSCLLQSRYHWSNSWGPWGPAELSDREILDRELDADARLGLTMERLDTDLLTSPKAPAAYDSFDPVIKQVGAKGFDISLKLSGGRNNTWMVAKAYEAMKTNANLIARFPPDENLFRQHVTESVTRWKHLVKIWEVANEPDNTGFWMGTIPEYAAMVKTAVSAARAVDPQCVVVNGGLCQGIMVGEDADPKKSEEVVRLTGADTSYMAFHGHGTFEKAAGFIEKIRGFQEKYRVPAPLIQTEGGNNAWRLDFERQQLIHVPRKILYAWSRGTRGWLLFGTRLMGGPRISVPPKERGSEAGWGYLDWYFCPRPLYGAISTLVDQLAGAQFEKIIVENEGLYIYQFRRGEQNICALFAQSPGKDDGEARAVTLYQKGGQAAAFDGMGNPTHSGAGQITLLVGALPVWVHFQGAPLAPITATLGGKP